MAQKTIGIDLLGADVSPDTIVRAVVAAAEELPSTHFRLFGFASIPVPSHPQITLQPVSECITMKDAPIRSVRHKKDSSLVRGVQSVAAHEIDAFITCGNTGALMCAATLFCNKTAPHIRPALLAEFPARNERQRMCVLDVGGNVTARAQSLVHFAYLGSSYMTARYAMREKPRVALLNIGEESEKGTSEVRKAHEWLTSHPTPFTFVGNVEGKDIFAAPIDVLVTAGFAGNIFLKTAEGIASFVIDSLSSISNHPGDSLFLKAKQNFSDAAYHGALLIGVDRPIFKCHGRASFDSLRSTCLSASSFAQLPEAISGIF